MTCNFNDYECDKIPCTVLLTICSSGHIRETYLCAKHQPVYMRFVKQDRILCGSCGKGVADWLQERL